MRDPNKIKSIMEEIEEYWVQHPALRLGQIIANCVRAYDGRLNCDPFYIEDEALIVGLHNLQ